MSNLAFISKAENKMYIIPYESEIKGIIFLFMILIPFMIPVMKFYFGSKKKA